MWIDLPRGEIMSVPRDEEMTSHVHASVEPPGDNNPRCHVTAAPWETSRERNSRTAQLSSVSTEL
jgi:hypothetical protein